MLTREKFSALLDLIRFKKPIGTLLLLWPTLWGLWIAAGGIPDWHLLAIFVAGTFLTRSAGCIINDVADRNFDGAVKRTRARPLATGVLTLRDALLFAGILVLLAFILVLFTNTLTIMLSFVAVGLAFIYPYMKRHTHLPQLVLGAAFSWGIPMAFAAQRGSLPPELWLLYAGNLLWTVVFDTLYAMVDRDDDLRIGLKSTAILFGDADRLIVAVLQVLCLLTLVLAGQRFGLGMAYYAALAIAGGLFAWHSYLIRARERQQCFRAVRHNNWVGLVIFLGIAAHYALAEHTAAL